MRLPWHKLDNPWREDLDLGAWVTLPPGSPAMIMGALYSVMRAQCDLSIMQVRLSRFMFFCSLGWMFVGALNLWYAGIYRGWW